MCKQAHPPNVSVLVGLRRVAERDGYNVEVVE